ncbi:DUF5047 domain-containing protein [Brevundimonas sp.]|uniref:DUF5047 domain-containing protein n=1 Tax=Brevundimonas sp. TaxID=1871086 RepID=UPI002D21F266|nr:DUF5047 domain-containing protein [Brevundimonas sp.]HYD28886.1 DUF5047 domain-containing protein [Brevundimonas sp.]
MRPVSQGFLAAVGGSHNIAVRLRAVPAGQTGTSPAGGVTLPLIGGDVVLDGGADIRSTLECEVAAHDPDTGEALWPEGASSPLTPYGAHELFVERGVAFGGGVVEYVSLGYFRINDVEQPAAPDGPIRITAVDRMAMIIDAKLTSVLQFDATETYGAVVEALAADAYGDVVIEWDDELIEGDAIGRTFIVEEDRYARLRELVTGVGKVAYFDHRGVLIVRSPPSPTLPLWTVSRGRGGVLVSAGRSLSRSGVYNGVLATGEALDTEPPVRALAVDSSASSPTYWGGPFGKVPRVFASPLLTTDSQAALAAATVLRRSLGLPYNVDFTAVPNPALEPDDPIAIGLEGEPRIIEPELIVGDSFSRVLADTIGAGETGHAWTPSTPSSQLAVNGSVFQRTMTVNTTASHVLPLSIGRRDLDVYVDLQVPIAAGGATLAIGALLRRNAADDFYTARLEFDADGDVSLKIADHGPLGYAEPATIDGYAPYTAAQWWTLRARAHDNVCELKAWPRDEQPEPNDWALSYDGMRPAAAGQDNRYGLYLWRLAGNTNNTGPQYLIDNFRAYDVPANVLRGGELHVLDTVTIPLVAAGALRGRTREQTLTSIETS